MCQRAYVTAGFEEKPENKDVSIGMVNSSCKVLLSTLQIFLGLETSSDLL